MRKKKNWKTGIRKQVDTHFNITKMAYVLKRCTSIMYLVVSLFEMHSLTERDFTLFIVLLVIESH